MGQSCIAMAPGLGTMVGWKHIVVTVGEKIGKDHLTCGQGAAAEIAAAVTTHAVGVDRAGRGSLLPVPDDLLSR
jgi:phosphate/sulfate permease